ncbi:4'-phosphopantetheinyl transferase family protein [Flavobacterium sp. '19STA2R22 D10 B1']|uniref:4'-phosphopantetheinyl transferase family protein n=1 Tax=Flavobacterium aerium TaxID=3037261 RepID=UPI00278C73EE|nr:4'-phosphopantetheinyl transferase superfamily protein [Flavobacterium sp. '19STA2R22 D10 B1']
MPIYKIITLNTDTKVLVWKITETFEALYGGLELNQSNCNRIECMKSDVHQRGFLSVRKLLEAMGYSDFDLFYDENGKPHLKDGKHISITHSFGFSAIIVSNESVGIDIELRREKIMKIANKFIGHEFEFLDSTKIKEYIRKLTVIWGAKEAIYKMNSIKGLSFKQHINVDSFITDNKQGTATVIMDELRKKYKFYFEEVEDFTLVYALES